MIAGVLAVVAGALGFATLAMNQTTTKAAVTTTILPLKDRHPATAVAVAAKTPAVKAKPVVKAKPKPKVKVKPVVKAKPKPKVKVKPKPKLNANYVAAISAGLPASVAHALASRRIVIVEIASRSDSVSKQAAAEAKDGAAIAGAGYVALDIDSDSATMSTLTRLLGSLPEAPSSIVYVRPATVYETLTGFNDRTAVEQAVVNAETPGAVATSTPASTSVAPATAAPVTAQ